MSTRPLLEMAIEGVLTSRAGAAQAITGAAVVAILRAQGWSLSLRRVGETAQRMRQRGIALLSSSSVPRGYFMAETVDEIDRALSELRERDRMIKAAISNLEACAYLRAQRPIPYRVPTQDLSGVPVVLLGYR
jgi:hypothetical protein